ncbi:MAG: FAD-dependent oxidoreductase [Oscillospiraceae bacterium]
MASHRLHRAPPRRILPAGPAATAAWCSTPCSSCPAAMGKGVLVTPTVHGNLLVGPTAADQRQRDCTATTSAGLRRVAETAARSVPDLPMRDVITSFAGLRAHLDGADDDFIVGESADGFFEARGHRVPGLSSAPAIGAVSGRTGGGVAGRGGESRTSIAERRDIVHPAGAGLCRSGSALAAETPPTATVVCRCEGISEGEIRDAIRRTRAPGPWTG